MTELQQQWADLALITIFTAIITYIDYSFTTYVLSLCVITSEVAICIRQTNPKELRYEPRQKQEELD